MRVAIVGAGPRGLFAIERLWAHLPDAQRVHVTVFDPQPPGVGAAYDPSQPDYLRLNVTSAVVAAGWPGETTVPSFDAWRAARGEKQPLEPFPPRARVGEYLAWFWEWLGHHSPTSATLVHCWQRVETISRAGEGWAVDGEPFDEVLLATGHEASWPGALSGEKVVPAVFPTTTWLSEECVPAGSRVAMRGAALTFIDAALALTEGRNGCFEGDWQSGLTYHRAGREPRVIWPIARSGRWMDPKPQPGTALATRTPKIIDSGRRAVLDAETLHDALATVRSTAVGLGADPAEADAILAPMEDSATELLRSRLAAMAGAGPTGAAWSLGHSWRGLYDSLRARFEGTGPGFEAFADLAGRLERVAFGPPPINAAKIVALIDAGIIDPGSLGTASFSGATPLGLPASPDVVVDAVLPPAGVVPGTLTARLMNDGLLTRPQGRRGVAVGADASCLDGNGEAVPGLACIGRATEDVVIGNDTLNRAMHPAVDGWARRIAGKGNS